MILKKIGFKAILLIFIATIILAGCSQTNDEETTQKLKLGVLSIEDILPLIVANEKGYFEEENLEVELITFQSAIESQSAIQSGEIDGMMTDIVIAAMLKDSGLNVKITSTTLGATSERRRFAILASPDSDIENPEDLKGKSIGISNNSIIEYVTDNLLLDEGISTADVEKTAIPKIPVRLEMLINNQIDAANVPEPLITYAESEGAKVIKDDTNNTQLSTAVLIMNEKALGMNMEGFYRAYDKALMDINSDPSQYKDTFVENISIPESIIEEYQVPTYPELQLPTEQEVNGVIEWLLEKELINNKIKYEDLIETGLY